MRKLRLSLLLSILVVSLSGCGMFSDLKKGISSAIESGKTAVSNAVETGKDNALLSELQNKNWSSDTLDSFNDWQAAEADLSKWQSTTSETYNPGFIGWLGGVATGKGFTKEQQIAWYKREASSKASIAQSNLETEMNKDDGLRSDVEEHYKNEGNIPWLLVIVIAVVAIILIVVLILRRKNEPQDEPEPIHKETGKIDLSSQRMGFNREKSARRICKELNLDYDKELAAVDGDLVKLMDNLYDKKGY